MKTELTKEQRKHLIDIGVPKNKANWSVITLLDILPKEIDGECLTISFGGELYDNNWFAYYGDAENGAMSLELIDAIYELVCRCFDKGNL